jgi:hypothetical protein
MARSEVFTAAEVDKIFRGDHSYQLVENLRMPSSGIWHRVGIVKTDVSEEHVASI